MLNINFYDSTPPEHNATVVLVDDGLKLDKSLTLLDDQYDGLISRIVKNKDLFDGKFGKIKSATCSTKNGIMNIIIVGIGDKTKLKESCIESLGGKIFSKALCLKTKDVVVHIDGSIADFTHNQIASLIATGASLISYRFDKYSTKQKEEDKFCIDSFSIFAGNAKETQKLFEEKQAAIEGVFVARDYISEPPNVLFPESYAERIVRDFEALNIDVTVLGEREMKHLGMNALLGVGQGSQKESKLVIMHYQGAKDKNAAPIAFVGKGVTFDTGGISIKPSTNMSDMKYDMAGSAAVVGAIKTLALRRAKANVVGVIGLVENMPGGNAQRPGDVVTTMSGQTAEVLDTDAEGRLVLADAVWYVQDKYNPQCVIDLATLTGAIVVALGNTYAGCFANDDTLAEQLIKSGEKVDEKLWRMPLHKDFDEMIKSDIADVANLGNVRGAAGSSTAAHFIARFIKEKTKWAHLDIAGMAWKKNPSAICPRGAVGYGVRLLNQFIQDNYEK